MEVRDYQVRGDLDCSEEHMRQFYELGKSAFAGALHRAGDWGDEDVDDHLGAFWLHCRDRWHQWSPSRGKWYSWMIRQARHYRAAYFHERDRMVEYDPQRHGGETSHDHTLQHLGGIPNWAHLTRHLTDHEASVLEQVVIQGVPPQELNRARGWSHNATHATLQRALAKVRKVLKARGERG